MRGPEDQELELEGVVERVTFVNNDSGFAVLKLVVPGEAATVTAVGPLAGAQPGESLRVHGRFVIDRTHGRQLKVTSYVPVLPATAIGIERYLGSGLLGGVAKGLAKKIVAHFGARTLEVIEREPERLTEVEGIGKKRKDRIVAAFREQSEGREVMLFLHSHGITTHHAQKIMRTYGREALAIVRANPYRLAEDIFGIGFRSADRIAIGLGLPRDAPRRAEAGLVYTLVEAAGDGEVFVPEAELLERAATLLEIDPAPLASALTALLHEGRLVRESVPSDPPVVAIYTRALHAAETGSVAEIQRILAAPLAHAERGQRVIFSRALAAYQARSGITLAGAQADAVRAALEAKLLVITGGPGTGKTTLVRAIIALLREEGRRIVLGAPTGRAARRLEGASGHPASTLHRLLDFSPGTMTFQRGPDAPLEADVVIVDESSMLDLPLFHQLLRAVPSRAQLILVGDVDQLPSVGPGRVLADLIESGVVPTVRLEHIFRQAEASAIVINAHRVNHGELPEVATDGAAPSDFYFIERSTPEQVAEALRTVVLERIPRRFGLDPIRDVQVLTPMHKGPLGVAQLNADLQAALVPAGRSVSRGHQSLRLGDKVIQLRNNYELDVSNGDVGRVIALDEEERRLTIDFDGRRAEYGPEGLDDLALAYAITIHKSQGSEFPAVVVPVSTQHYVMLRRNLLYTAITRGRRLVVLIGDRRALGLAVSERRLERRSSALGARLRVAVRIETPGQPRV